MTRYKAALIAKDLVEGGIGDADIETLTAQSHHVTIQRVWSIKRVLTKHLKSIKTAHRYSAESIRKQAVNESLCSMVEAIENGWEDEALKLNPE